MFATFTIQVGNDTVAEFDADLNTAIRRAAEYGDDTVLRAGKKVMWASMDITERNYPFTLEAARAHVAGTLEHMRANGYTIHYDTTDYVHGSKGGVSQSAAVDPCAWNKARYRVF